MCDFLAIYRLRVDPAAGDLAGLTGPQFLRYATRLPAYDGAVTALFARERARRDEPPPAAEAAPGVRMVEATPLTLTTDPLLRQFISYGQAPKVDAEVG